jgi:uncharacterized membrane protein YdjX (TVP38/TMEM64 family)
MQSAAHNPDEKTERPAVFWLLIGATALLLALLLYSTTFKALLDQATGWATKLMNARPVAGALVFFLFSALSAMLAFTSSAVLIPPANLVWGRVVTFFLLWGGWVAGAIAAFGVGRLARPLLVRLGYQKTLEGYQQFVSKRMKFWQVVLFCIAVPSEIPGYLFGGLHYPFLRFLAAIAIAESIYGLGLIVAGDSLVTARPLRLLITVAIMIVIAAGAGWLLRRLRKRKLKLRVD